MVQKHIFIDAASYGCMYDYKEIILESIEERVFCSKTDFYDFMDGMFKISID